MGERKPSDDLKEGLFLLFRAARGMAKDLDTSKVEKTVSDGAKELARVINSVGKTLSSELEKTFHEDPPGKKPGEGEGEGEGEGKATDDDRGPGKPPAS